MCIEAEHKLDTLFSFIKSHKDSKCIVFFSSCKQVRHAYESISKLKTGASLMEIHGRQKQIKRTAIYFEFVERKFATLFATDVASRGIDFPAVDWVIQVDIPEDTDTYIHRVGRTARYKYKGSSLLMVQPHEMKFVEKLKKLNINMKKLKANPNRTLSITSALQRINAENTDMMHLAQRAFICYIRSVFKNGDKEIFDVKKINHEALAQSLGLVTTPVIEFVEGDELKNTKMSKLQKLREKIKQKKHEQKVVELEGEGDDEEVEDHSGPDVAGSEDDDMDEVLSHQEEEDQEEDDLFTVKRRIAPDEPLENEDPALADEPRKVYSKNQLKKIKKGGVAQGKNKVYFGADGKTMTSLEYHMQKDTFKNEEEIPDDVKPEDYFNKIKMSLDANKEIDNQIALQRLKVKRLKRKRQRDTKRQEQENQRLEDNEDYEGEGEGDEADEQEEDEDENPTKHKHSKHKKDKHKEGKSKRQKRREKEREEVQESSDEPEDL